MSNIHNFSLVIKDYYYSPTNSFVTDRIKNIVVNKYYVGIPNWVYAGKTLSDMNSTTSLIFSTGTLDAVGISEIIS